jgi:hypothetical protein
MHGRLLLSENFQLLRDCGESEDTGEGEDVEKICVVQYTMFNFLQRSILTVAGFCCLSNQIDSNSALSKANAL